MDDLGEVGSDDEDLESGKFLEHIKVETEKAMKERRYLLKELKAKERRGSIFIDKVGKIVATIQRESNKYDYLIEWQFNARDHLTPTTSIVKGSHLAFAKPLLYRRFVEEHYIEERRIRGDDPKIL